jgi:DnaJ-class molecular chaperone
MGRNTLDAVRAFIDREDPKTLSPGRLQGLTFLIQFCIAEMLERIAIALEDGEGRSGGEGTTGARHTTSPDRPDPVLCPDCGGDTVLPLRDPHGKRIGVTECGACSGTGWKLPRPEPVCGTCGGSRMITLIHADVGVSHPCPDCAEEKT